MYQVSKGFCPVQNCEFEVTIEYKMISMNTPQELIKTSMRCPMASKGLCNVACPLFDQAPQILNL